MSNNENSTKASERERLEALLRDYNTMVAQDEANASRRRKMAKEVRLKLENLDGQVDDVAADVASVKSKWTEASKVRRLNPQPIWNDSSRGAGSEIEGGVL